MSTDHRSSSGSQTGDGLSIPPTGEVNQVERNVRTATFEWQIKVSFRLDECVRVSPAVTFFDMKWRLSINNIGHFIDGICLYRTPLTPGLQEPVHFSITCKTSDGQNRNIVRDQTLPGNSDWCGGVITPPLRIRPLAVLIFTVSLWKVNSPRAADIGATSPKKLKTHHSNATSILLEHYKNLLLSGDGHDVLIKVGDKQFTAHKHILRCRSAAFAKMFPSDMAETVTLEDSDPHSFGQLLQFVYCGEADIASVGSALGLYRAADEYGFPTLKEMCVDFLKGSLSTTTVFDVVSLSALYNEEELLKQSFVYFANHLEEVMETEEWQRFLLVNPIEANEMILKALKCLRTS